jgi:DNA excision repair protein ERCC-2
MSWETAAFHPKRTFGWLRGQRTAFSIAPSTAPPETRCVASAPKPVRSVQVRELVEFALRQGDLGGERDFVGPNRALAGTRGHQRLQRSRPAGYQREVRLCHDIETADFILRIQGRIDGLLVTAQEVLLEEIKTVQGGWDGEADPLHWAQAKLYGFIYAHGNALAHLTIQLTYLDLDTSEQTELRNRFTLAELSAFFEDTTAIYLDWLRAQHQWCQQRDQSIRALEFPFSHYRPGQRRLAVAAYRVLASGGRLFLEAPTGIGKTISVLFPAVKALGEGKIERVFYLTARTVGRAVAEKALADLRQAGLRLRTLTLTAKEKICPGVHPSSGAASSDPQLGLESSEAGVPTSFAAPGDGRTPAAGGCDPLTCPFARGYYDRCKPAMRAALAREEITRPVLEAVSRDHQVCPFELSLDLSSWVDVIVCDYNYVFDPRVYLRRHFAEEPGDYAFLVDEAHNLVDRARDMFSADLNTREIQEVRRALKQAVPRCAKALSRLTSAMRRLCAPEPDTLHEYAEYPQGLTTEGPFPLTPALSLWERENRGQSREVPKHAGFTDALLKGLPLPKGEGRGEGEARVPTANASTSSESRAGVPPGLPRAAVTIRDFPADLTAPLDDALKQAEIWLARNQPADFRDSLLELYFRLRTFRRTADLYDERFVTITEPGRSVRVRLFCLDPSFLLRQALARGKAAVFFSATLTPIDYYRALLGGSKEDPLLQLPSPFPPEHLAVLVQDRIRTHLKARAGSLPDVVQAIASLVEGRPGNYLVYLPSYQYLTSVQEQFRALHPAVPILVQRPGMSEPEREAFLAAFAVEHGETLVGFAVMGGVFGEGIDLVGDRLIGAIIVGVGLPQLCIERDLIRDYFQEQTGAGFDYAYTFPGMNRVLQAIGRVIRSETDRGVVLLIDARFAEPRYRRLFPTWWQPAPVRNASEIRNALAEFWQPSHHKAVFDPPDGRA